MSQSIRNWFNWRGWAVLFSAIAIVLGLAAILSPAFRGFIGHATTAAWASAIATFLAAGVALFISGAESRRRQRDQVAMAALYAGYLAPKFERYCDDLDDIRAIEIFSEDEQTAMLHIREKLG
jgi:hypothetical protein